MANRMLNDIYDGARHFVFSSPVGFLSFSLEGSACYYVKGDGCAIESSAATTV